MSCSAYRGTRAFLSAMRAIHHLDHSQAESVYHMARKKTRPNKTAPTREEWQALVDAQRDALALDDSVPLKEFERLYRYLTSVREEEPPDALTYAALKDLPGRAEKAVAAVRRQIHSAAALRGVHPDAVRERFQAYRDQYLRELRRLPADLRPDPPAEWVTGYRRKDMMAVSSPQDRATLYAMYRCQADPTAFPIDPGQRIASIDLETAAPPGRDGMSPENGCIIEVGIVEYDFSGRKIGRYSQLIRPTAEIAAACGTGAVEVHGITLDDVRDAPSWAEVAPATAERLAGRVMMAQNARFERDWLAHHLTAQKQSFEKYGPTIDTLTIARQHFSALPNHRLSTICGHVGVPYTNGHRAEHDADVTVRAFFRMRERIFATWAASPARANAPQPAVGAGLRPRTGPNLQRLSGKDFDPTTVQDQWSTAPPVGADAAA